MLYEFINVKESERNKHKAKIIAALKKEGYQYDYTLDGYKKPIWE